MESSLFYFLVGLSIFATNRMIKWKSESVRMLSFIVCGGVSGYLITLFAGTPWHAFGMIPPIGVPVITGLAGILLYVAEKNRFFTQNGIQYVATIVLGLILAGLSFGLLTVYHKIRGIGYLTSNESMTVFLMFLLMNFITVFGYTFPERWFKQKQIRDNSKPKT